MGRFVSIGGSSSLVNRGLNQDIQDLQYNNVHRLERRVVTEEERIEDGAMIAICVLDVSDHRSIPTFHSEVLAVSHVGSEDMTEIGERNYRIEIDEAVKLGVNVKPCVAGDRGKIDALAKRRRYFNRMVAPYNFRPFPIF